MTHHPKLLAFNHPQKKDTAVPPPIEHRFRIQSNQIDFIDIDPDDPEDYWLWTGGLYECSAILISIHYASGKKRLVASHFSHLESKLNKTGIKDLCQSSKTDPIQKTMVTSICPDLSQSQHTKNNLEKWLSSPYQQEHIIYDRSSPPYYCRLEYTGSKNQTKAIHCPESTIFSRLAMPLNMH